MKFEFKDGAEDADDDGAEDADDDGNACIEPDARCDNSLDTQSLYLQQGQARRARTHDSDRRSSAAFYQQTSEWR